MFKTSSFSKSIILLLLKYRPPVRSEFETTTHAFLCVFLTLSLQAKLHYVVQNFQLSN